MPQPSDNPGRLANPVRLSPDVGSTTAEVVDTAVHLLIVREAETPLTLASTTQRRAGVTLAVVVLRVGGVEIALGFEAALAVMRALEDEAGPPRARLVDAQRVRRAAFNAMAQAFQANLAAIDAEDRA